MAEYPKLHVMFFETGLESVGIVQKSRMLLFTGNFTYFSWHAMKKVLQRFYVLEMETYLSWRHYWRKTEGLERSDRFAMALPH